MLKVFVFDLNNNKVKVDDKVYPTEITQDQNYWLYASNNKYANRGTEPSKTGKWMLFLPGNKINAAWDKIKKAIQEGHLWHAKVSTRDNDKPIHAIMIYTRDYTDIKDVVRVLNYLETCGLKPSKSVIRYKTDNQTRAGIYSGGPERPWIYSSDSIREKITNELSPVENDQPPLPSTANATNSNTHHSKATSSTSQIAVNVAIPDSWEELDSEVTKSPTLSQNVKESTIDDNTFRCKK